MRIAILNQFYTPDISPTAHLSASLADGLAEHGHAVTVVASRGGYVKKSSLSTHRVGGDNPRVYRVWTPRLGKATILKRCIDYATFYLLAAWRMIRLPRQDVIISLTTPPYIGWATTFHRWLHPSTKIVLWNMDCYPDAAERVGVIRKGGLLSRLMRAMNRALFRRLDHLICLDTAMVDLLVSQYAPPNKKLPVTIIPNWERASLFPDPRTAPVSPPWRGVADLRLENKFVILYLGNMGVGHPFETVIDAATQLRDRNVVFLFVGGGKRFDWVKSEKERLGLDNLLLHGYVDKEFTPAVMAAASCALITLSPEMLGVMSPSKLHSNLAMALPILYVGPPCSNVDDAIATHHCGRTIAPGDSPALIAFIDDLLQNPEARAAVSGRARAAFDAAYNDEKTIPQFIAVINSLFPDARAPTA